MPLYIYIYIYIYRERERKGDRYACIHTHMSCHMCVYIYIYTYISSHLSASHIMPSGLIRINVCQCVKGIPLSPICQHYLLSQSDPISVDPVCPQPTVSFRTSRSALVFGLCCEEGTWSMSESRLYIHICIYIYICICLYLSIYLYVDLSIYLSIYLNIYLNSWAMPEWDTYVGKGSSKPVGAQRESIAQQWQPTATYHNI